MMAQQTFNPIKYGFEWTTDGWYKFGSGHPEISVIVSVYGIHHE